MNEIFMSHDRLGWSSHSLANNNIVIAVRLSFVGPFKNKVRTIISLFDIFPLLLHLLAILFHPVLFAQLFCDLTFDLIIL